MDNKLAVITGAASGIGLALTKACLLEGMDVVMVDVNEAALKYQVKDLNPDLRKHVVEIVCDVSKEDDVSCLADYTYARFKKVDLLINNAGVSGELAPIWELSSKEIRRVLDINLHGVLNGIQSFVPLMLEQNHAAHIVNMASFYGLCSGSHVATYAMSKHAIVALSESLYFDLKRLQKPISISVVCPSFTDTKLLCNSANKKVSNFHHMINNIMSHSSPAEDVAADILRGINQKTFYILPDKEVKNYCEQRTNAIIKNSLPFEHNVEKIVNSLLTRSLKRKIPH